MIKFTNRSSTLLLTVLSITFLLAHASGRYGLRSSNNEAVNLLSLETSAFVEGPYAHVEYIQKYQNPNNHPIETEYYFPRTESSIFHKFEAIFQDKVVTGQIFEKQQALDMYKWNVERGHTAAYSERNALTPDVMKIIVGNIPAHESITIKFSVIQPLEVIVNKFYGLNLVSVLTERYAPASFDSTEAPHIKNVDLEKAQYKEWKVHVEVSLDTPFEYVLNPTHNIEPKFIEGQPKGFKAVWDTTIAPNQNFIIYFKPKSLETLGIVLAQHPKHANDFVALLNFVPELNSLELSSLRDILANGRRGFLELKDLLLKQDTESAKAEFIFVIDRSGSMHGARIANLRQALASFLKILPKDSFFNIISFGSSFSSYSPKSIKYSTQSLDAALQWITTIQADMGGTEIFRPLEYVTTQALHEGYPRSVFLLTDGDVYNPDQVISLAFQNADKMKFSTVGIGHGASEYIIKNVAKAGKGTSEFVLDNEDIGEKAIYMVKAAVSQYIKDIDFTTKCFNANGDEIFTQEGRVDLLLKDQPFKKWIYLKNAIDIKSCEVLMKYYNSMKKDWVTEKFDIEGFETAEKTDIWHKVAYDAKIRDLDLEIKFGENQADVSKKKAEIIGLSTKYQILTDYTAFFAVIDEKVLDKPQKAERVSIDNVNSVDYSHTKPTNQNPSTPSYQSHSTQGHYPTGSAGRLTLNNFVVLVLAALFIFMVLFD